MFRIAGIEWQAPRGAAGIVISQPAAIGAESQSGNGRLVPERLPHERSLCHIAKLYDAIPAGESQASFPVTLHHAHDGPALANLAATYGASDARTGVTVLPIAWKERNSAKPPATPKPHVHDHAPEAPAKPPGP